jgi:hypothetical protein
MDREHIVGEPQHVRLVAAQDPFTSSDARPGERRRCVLPNVEWLHHGSDMDIPAP